MLRRIRETLKSSGRLDLLEYRKEDPKVPIREEHKMSVARFGRNWNSDFYASLVIEAGLR
jgi:hypothetical protein